MTRPDYSRSSRRGVGYLGFITLLAAVAVSATARAQSGPFDNDVAPAPPPVNQFGDYTLHQPPALGGLTAKAATASAVAFLRWAGSSVLQEREDARGAIQGAGNNTPVVHAFGRLAFNARRKDYTKALLALSILGEMRSLEGAKVLRKFVAMKVPKKGPLDWETGQNLAATRRAQLQAKAIDGLAYLPDGSGDADVLNAIANHPARIVRAEAIEAFLWNHGDTDAARQTVLSVVRPEEAIFLHRVRREYGESADTFDVKIDNLLSQHPELVPPPPVPQDAQAPSDYAGPGQPPSDGFDFSATCETSYPTCGGPSCRAGANCIHSTGPEGCSCYPPCEFPCF